MSNNLAKDVNLLTGYRRSLSAGSGKKKKKTSAVFIIIMVAVLFLGAFAVLTVENLSKAVTLAQITAETEDLQAEYDAALQKENILPVYSDVITELDSERIYTESIPTVSSEIWKAVDICAADKYSISSYSYSADKCALTMEVHADTVNDVPTLVEALRDTGLFFDIEYYGYTNEPGGTYFCTVGCRLLNTVILPEEEDAT